MFQLDLRGDKPLYLQLRDALRARILSGELPPGKLPSSRELAQAMHLSRGTVDEAYRYLMEDGLLETRRGLGTFVLPTARVQATPSGLKGPDWESMITPSARRFTHYREEVGRMERPAAGVISFASLAPDHHVFSAEAFRKAMNDALAREGGVLLNYGYVPGYEPLRGYLKEYLGSKGIDFAGQQLLITNGFRQGVELVLRTLVEEGETVFVEAPCYNGVLGLLKSRGARIVPIEMDGQGMSAQALERALQKERPKLIYCVPTYQNPTGLNMSFERRERILSLCAQYGVPVLEDGFSEELRYRGESYPALKAMDRSGVVIYAGSFSKVLFPGLRVGWVVAPEALARYLLNEKYNEDIHTAVLQQAGLYEFCRRGHLERHLRASRALYRQRMETMLSELERHFSDIAHWPRSDGGFSVFVSFEEGVDTRRLLKAARRSGVLYVPGDVFYPDGRGKNSLRLGFSRLECDKIVEGMARLRRVFREELGI